MTTIVRTSCSWLLLAVLITVAVGCDDDQIVTPGPGDSPSSPIVVRLVPDKPSYGLGESVTIQVLIESAVSVDAVAFRLRYNPAVLEYVVGAEGAFLGDDGTDTAFFSSVENNEVVVGMSRLGSSLGASGAGVLATLEFLAVGNGVCEFDFTGAVIRDPNGQSLPVAWNTIPVAVEQSSPIVLRLVPDKPTYGLGQSVTTQVLIESAVGVASVAFRLRYNPAVLEYVVGAEGAFLGDDGTDTVFLSSVDNDEVVAAMSRLGNDLGASGAGVLATLEFLAVGNGVCEFDFIGAVIRDPNGQNLPTAWSTSPVAVEQ